MSGLQFILLVSMLSMSWLLVFILTPFFIKFANKVDILDKPSSRKIHSKPIPRIGGLAIFSAFVIPFSIFYIMLCLHLKLPLSHIFYKYDWLGLLVGGLIVFTVGFVDDLRGLPPGLKMFFQAIAALSACYGGLVIHRLYIPFWGSVSLSFLAYPITMLWFLLIINGFNLIDGMDGLVAVTSFICGFFLLILCLQGGRFFLALPAIIITGATLGFFHFNMNPAKVFMGDSGSYFLGFNLAALALKVVNVDANNGVNLLIPALIFALPIADSAMAIFRRLVRGQHIFCPDTDHIHHCLLKRGFRQNEVLALLCCVTIITGLSAVLANYLPDNADIILFVLVMFVLINMARRVGYLDCFSESEICRLSNLWFRKLLLKVEIWKLDLLCSSREGVNNLTSVLSKIFEMMRLDYAVLIVEVPPEAKSDIESIYEYVEGNCKPDGGLGLMSIKLPLYCDNLIYGELHVEKQMVISDLPPEFIFKLVSTIANIVVRKLKKYSTREIEHVQLQRKRSTFILIPDRRTAE